MTETKSKNPYLVRDADMNKITYQNSHLNEDYPESSSFRGKGNNNCKFINSHKDAHISGFPGSANLENIIESYLEENASIGYHTHYDTDEYYYILEGNLYVEYDDADHNHYSDVLHPGDLHRISAKMSHTAKAAAGGCKFLAIIVKAQ